MKFKGLLATALFVGSLFVATTSAFAATGASIGEVTTNSAGTLYTIPVTITSSDYNACAGYVIQMTYDNTKYTASTPQNKMVIWSEDDEDYIASGSITPTNTDIADANGWMRAVWTSDDGSAVPLSEGPQLTFRFRCKEGVTFDIEDFQLTLNQFGYATTANIKGDNGIGTWVDFSIPKTLDDSWTYGYVHAAYLDIDGTQYQLTNCLERADDYYFVTLIKNTKGDRQAANIKIVLDTATSEDATEFTQVTYKDFGSVVIEDLVYEE